MSNARRGVEQLMNPGPTSMSALQTPARLVRINRARSGFDFASPVRWIREEVLTRMAQIGRRLTLVRLIEHADW